MTEKLGQEEKKQIQQDSCEPATPQDVSYTFSKKTYYVEDRMHILEMLTRNCRPILSELKKQIKSFNAYNDFKKMKEMKQVL